MLKFITNAFSKEVLGSKSVSLAFVALVLAILIACVGYFIFAFTGGRYNADGTSITFGAISAARQTSVLVAFLISFPLAWFILDLQYNREAEDIYSRLREKLVGTWQVTYELMPDQNENSPWERTPAVICEIAVNEATKKLEIAHEVKDHPLFANGLHIIQSVAFRHDHDNRYSMSYYYKTKRDLSPLLSLHLLADDGSHQQRELDIEVFATLTFEDLPKSQVKLIKGEWFDLNGNLIRLFSIVSELKSLPPKDRTAFKKKLSDATISRENFVALMGDITFSR